MNTVTWYYFKGKLLYRFKHCPALFRHSAQNKKNFCHLIGPGSYRFQSLVESLCHVIYVTELREVYSKTLIKLLKNILSEIAMSYKTLLHNRKQSILDILWGKHKKTIYHDISLFVSQLWLSVILLRLIFFCPWVLLLSSKLE